MKDILIDICPLKMTIKNWLITGCILIYVMLVVGCITRLTHSGLSITNWSLFGSFPPLNQNDWQALFELYKQSPEYRKVNYFMEIEDFKSIYFWEYLHRMLGRFIGLVFISGFFYFLIKKKLNQNHYKKFIFLFLLGLLQGLIGWWMVKSGLSDKPAVSHYRLAIHLISAFMLFSLTFIFYLDEVNIPQHNCLSHNITNIKKIKIVYILTLTLFIVQVIFGAFTAGFVEGNNSKVRPGNIFNTWPKMGETWFPDFAIFRYDNHFKNFFENAAGIQFIHRWLGFLVLMCIIILASQTKNLPKQNKIYIWITLMLYAVVLQLLLGVYTLVENVPVYMGVLHQSGALLLCMTLIGTGYYIFKKDKVNGKKIIVSQKPL
ncbi:MAG: COX15/CtaA family protein [Bacteroidia bacterium]|nr:COX15/CtaA family protein [Bacteroidia bacterium]